MSKDLLIPFAALTVISLLAALTAWFRKRPASAHALNVIPSALIGALSVFTLATHTAEQIAASGLALLAALIALVLFCVIAAARSARWRTLFWLTVLVNLGVVGGLIYLRFYFRIF